MQQVKWGEFVVGKLFDIHPTKSYGLTNANLFTTKGNTPVVTNTNTNNGISCCIGLPPTERGGVITYSDTTTSDAIFYQPYDFVGYSHIQGLYPFEEKKWDGEHLLWFVTSFRKATSNQFDYGNKFNREIAKRMKVKLPILPDGNIDFGFIAEFVAELEAQRVAELATYLQATGLNDYTLTEVEKKAINDFHDITFGDFTIESLFGKVKVNSLKYKTSDLPSIPTGEFVLPALTAGIQNQGLNNYVPLDNATILNNVISISANGANTGATFFQSKDFTVLQDAYAIEWEDESHKLSENQYLYMTGAISKAIVGNYEWTNKAGWERIKSNTISVPINNGVIDFVYIDILIAAIKKLAIRDVVKFADRKIAATKEIINK